MAINNPYADPNYDGTNNSATNPYADPDYDGGQSAAKSGTIRRALGDTGISLLKGAIGVPETVVGIADLVTGGHAGKLAESAGFKPKQAKAFISDYYSPEQKLANQKVQEADGFVNTIKAALQNPSTIAQTTAESLPVMGLGGVASRGLLAVAPKVAPFIAGAAGEGIVTAGQNAEQLRQETADGLLTGKQAAIQAGSGLLTGVISGASGKLANSALGQKLGLADIETMLATGKLTGQATKSLPTAIAGNIVTEGLLEEMPQSAQEQIAQNLSLGKPWDEGVGNAAAMGALSGGLMGGGAKVLDAFGGNKNSSLDNANTPPVTPPPTQPPAPEGSLTSAATIAQAVGLTPQPVTPDVTEQKPNIVDSLNAVEAQQNGVISDTTIAPEQPLAEMPAPTLAPEQAAEKQRIDEIAHQAATSPLNDLPQPTDAQKEAGNYKKAHLKYDGLDITVENPQGSTRSGVDEDGATWQNTLANHYGYIKRTKGNDGDNLDVFVGDKPASGKVFVINQTKKDGSFDEHKAVLGAETADEAIAIYKANYAEDWNGGKSVTELTTPAFKDWLKNGDPTKPLETVSATSNDVDMTKVAVGEQVDVGGVPYVKTENGFERVTSATNNVADATTNVVNKTTDGVQTSNKPEHYAKNSMESSGTNVVNPATTGVTEPITADSRVVQKENEAGKYYSITTDGVGEFRTSSSATGVYTKNKFEGGKTTDGVLNIEGDITDARKINRLENVQRADEEIAWIPPSKAHGDIAANLLAVSSDIEISNERAKQLKEAVTKLVKGHISLQEAQAILNNSSTAKTIPSITPENVNTEIAAPATETAQPTDTVRPLVEQLTKLRATADKHPSFEPALKAAKDFMAGKKVSPRQFKNFANLLGKKNKAFREVLMQLHDQAASTPEQLAAKEKKSKLAKAMLEERMKLDTTKDGLMQAMAKLGGLNADKAKAEFGIDPADMRQHGAGIKRSFNKNGLDADTMRELLKEQGYPVGETVADLGNAIADAMSGIDVLTPAGQEALAQKKYEEYANAIDELSDDEQALLDKLVTKATAKYGAEALAEIDASLAESMKDQPQPEIERALLRMLKEEFDDETGNAGTSQATEGQAGQDTETGSTETGSGRAQQDGANTESQGSNTSQDLLGDNTAAKQALADAERAKDAKRNSGTDNQDTFTLSGSDSEFEQARAAGAQDLVEASQAETPAEETTQDSVAPKTEAPAEQPKPETKPATVALKDTSDVGIEMLGNRRNKGLSLADIQGANNDTERVAMAVKTKLWERPDYQALVDSGVQPAIAHIVKQIYDGLSAKPAYKGEKMLYDYVNVVEATKKAVDEFLSDKNAMARMITAVAVKAKKQSWMLNSNEVIDISNIGNENDTDIENYLNYFVDRIFPKNESGARWGRQNKEGNDKANATGNRFYKNIQLNLSSFIDAMKAVQQGFPAKQEAWQRSYQIKEADGKFQVIKKGRYSPKSEHATREEAEDAARALVKREREEAFKEPETPVEKSIRKGRELRANGNVSSQELQDAVGLKAVNFGDWMKKPSNAKERQSHVNSAFDAFHDLAEVLNLPVNAMSLDGMLGLAIGAQGKGKAAAHFYPGYNEINLTREKGAGSLAHEWAHGLDHYFGVQAGLATSENPFASWNGRYRAASESDIRPEVADAFNTIVESMRSIQETPEAAKERITATAKASKERIEQFIERNGLKEAVKDDETAQKALDEIIAGETGEYVIWPALKGKRKPQGYTSEHVKLLADKLGWNFDRANDLNLTLAGHSAAQEALKTEPILRKIHTDYYRAASIMDGSKEKAYWSTPHELFARAFEMYVAEKIANADGRNDYLVAAWKQAEEINTGDKLIDDVLNEAKKRYPQGKEREAINAAFDVLFNEIKTKETDKGIALYQNKEEYGNYGITEKQRSELTEPERRAYDQSAATAIALRGVKNSVLGLAVSKDFKQTGSTSLLGKQIATPEDLAVAAQIYRDPRFETVRYFFIKDGSVISQTSVTSKLAGVATLSPNVNGEGVAEFISEIATEAANLGADGVYLLHNHPDGNPTPSKVDVTATKFIQGVLSEKNIDLLGHVIINHQKYAVIDRENNQQVIERKFENTYSNDNPAVPHAILGKVISDQYDLAEHAKAIEFTEGNIVLIGTSGTSGISVITEIEPADLKPLKLAAILRKLSRQSGAESLFAYNVPLNLSNLAAKAIKNGILVDAITTDTYGNKQSLRSFIDPDDNVTMGRPLKGYVVKQTGVNEGYPVSAKGLTELTNLKENVVAAKRQFDKMTADRRAGNLTLEQYEEVLDGVINSEADLAKALVALPDEGFALQGKTRSGHTLILAPSVKNAGQWQLSRFDDRGAYGDSERKTKLEAVKLLIEEADVSTITDHDVRFSSNNENEAEYIKNLQSTWDNAKELTDEQARNDIDLLRRSASKNGILLTEQTLSTAIFKAITLPKQRELDLIAKQFGKRLVGFAINPKYAGELDAFDGVTVTNKNIIFLRAGTERPHLVLLGHELTHNLKSDNPALYSELLNAIKPYVKDLADFAQNYEGMSIPDISEEFISDVVADGFMSDKFWNALGEHNPSLLSRVVDAVKNLINTISKKFRFNPEMKPYLTDYNKVMELAGKAMAKYANKSDDAKYSRPSAPTFYSALAKAIPLAKQDTMPAGQWKNWLVANAGKMNVKQAELQWSGLTDYLDLQQGKVSKTDIQQYLDANGVQVTETMLHSTEEDNSFDIDNPKLPEGNGFSVTKNNDGQYEVWNYDDFLGFGNTKGEAIIDAYNGYPSHWINGKSRIDTKYDKYTVAGGENYKELLLTLPEKTPEQPSIEWNERVAGEWNANVEGRTFGILEEDRNSFYVYEKDGNLGKKVRSLDEAKEQVANALIKNVSAKYRSSHFDQSNILAHVRFDERTDADGNKVLFINEIQSDWGQDGKKKGFVSDGKLPDGWGVFESKNGWYVIDNSKTQVGIYMPTKEEAIRSATTGKGYTGGTPLAPFVTETKSWVSLALKRMIRYAAENGFDKVALINGQQAADLYDLSKQVDNINYSKNEDGTYRVYAMRDEGTVFTKDSVAESKLDELFGKDIAQKIINDEGFKPEGFKGKRLEGDNLKVGGDGMRYFYNSLVPQVANDVLKKIGGGKVESLNVSQLKDGWRITTDTGVEMPKVYESKLEAEKDADKVNGTVTLANIEGRGLSIQLGFTITPELRAKALEGLPLFSRPKSKFTEQAKQAQSIDIRDLNAVVANVNQALRGLPATHVLEDYTKAPAELVADIKRDKAYDAAGAWHNGEIYLFRNNIINTNHALFTMLHESTHEGLRRVFGKEIDATLMGIYLSNQDIKQQADSLRATHKDLSLVASVEEALADMGGNGIKASVMDKLIAFVRNVLRRLGANLNVSDSEVRAIVTRALDSVKSPSKVTHYTIGSAYSAASSGDQTDTPQFKAWFGDSKVVDAHGKPLVVYHGTKSDITVFNPTKGNGLLGDGIYTTSDRKQASETYAGRSTGSNIMPLYVSIQNPIVTEVGYDVPLNWQELGYDGVIYKKKNEPVWYIAANANQIKSAIGNNGDFDPTNPDIRYSRPTPRLSPVVQPTTPNQQWQSPDKSKLDNVIYMLQNKFVDLKRVIQGIQKAGNSIDDKWNPYLQEELYTGRTATRTKDFIKHELEPLMKSMQARKVEMADFEEYLWARHAEEYNIQVAGRNPKMPDGGSGMMTQDARDYLANLTPAQTANYQALAAKVDAILKNSRQRLIDYGLETPEMIAAWEGAYQYYVPFMREDMENGLGNGIGQGFSVKGNASKRATGSKRAVVDILANIAQQVERNIIRGEKNRVSTALVGLATLNPNKDFWKVDVVPKMRTVVAGKNTYEVLYSGSVVQTFTNPVEANKFIQWNGAGYTLNVVKGQDLVMDVPDPSYKNRDNIVVARIVNAKGKIEEHFVEFNTHDERAMRAAAAIKNLDQDQIGELLGTSASITRYFSSINTQYNPFFGVINILRDVQASLLNLSSTELAGKQMDVLKNTPLALMGIYNDIRSERKTGTPTNSYWSLLFEDYQQQGGQTGYRDMYRNAKERGEALKHALDPTWWQQTTAGKIVTINGILAKPEQFLIEKGQQYIFDWLSDYNETMENSVRLSAYKVGLDNGMSKAQAASLAKNISVNFNRKGEMGRQIGSLYAFFNASVQGTARIGETLFTDDNGKLTLSKAGKAIVTGGLLLGVMQALMLAAAGFGDDEPPQFVRDRNLIIPLGNGKAITIAMPLGFNALPAFGRILTEWALSGGKDTSKRFVHIFDMLAEVTNPIGNAGLSMQTIAPTILDPIAALAENKDWTGRPIAKMDFNAQKPTAGHTRAKDTASAISKGLSYAINEVTGGSDYTPGALSPTPDQIDYLIGQLTGGVGREYMKLEQTATAMTTGEELPVYKIPLVGRFYLDTEGQSSQSSRFYDNLKSVFETETELKGLRKDGLDTSEYRASHPEAALVFRANLEQREISQLHKLRSEKLKADAPPEEIKALNERITARMLKFNELFITRTTAGE